MYLPFPLLTDSFKRLVKKYSSLKDEYALLIRSLETDPVQGAVMSNNCYKIRVAIKSKSKGKSGGTRVITHVKVIDNKVFLLAIYDKSEQEDISDKEIDYLLSFINL